MKKNFSEVYNAVYATHKRILPIDDKTIGEIEHQVSQSNIIKSYYPATMMALFFFATAPAIFSYNLSKMKPQIEPFVRTINSYVTSGSLTIHTTLIFLFFGTLIYTLIYPRFNARMPQDNISKFSWLRGKSLLPVEKNFNFYVYAGILNYFNMYIAFAYISAVAPQEKILIHCVVYFWAMLPTLFFCIAPTFALMIMLLLLEVMLARPKATHPYVVIDGLFRLLQVVDNASFGAWNNSRSEISEEINEISYMILTQKHHYDRSEAGYSEISRKFSNSSFHFQNTKSLLYLQSSDSKRKITTLLVRILNIFISGNMSDLPETATGTNHASRKRHSTVFGTIVHLLLLGAFLSLPIVAWIAAVHHFQLHINSSEDAMVRILYAVWSIFGLVSFSEHLAPETKSMFYDIARGIAPKWRN